MTTASYWLEEPAERLPRSPWQGVAEVAVVGGGVTGCSCALRLAENGVRVRLYEAREVAGGASGRNVGFALRGAAEPYDAARRRLGTETARRLMTLTEQTQERMAVLAGDALRRDGSLRLAGDEAEARALRAEHEALRADGFAVEWVDDLDGPLGRLYRGAIFHPGDAALQPARWVRRLARHAAAAGADIREHERVTLDDLAEDAVVVCGDGFTAALLPELAGLVRPTRGQVLATEPAPLRYPRPHYARNGYDYWHQLPDGRLVIGGQRDSSPATEATDVEDLSAPIQARVEELAAALLEAPPRVTHRWSGIWGTTPDLLPLAGRVPGRDGVWVAGGYSGHGNVLGFACGRLVADALLGHPADELRVFDPGRFA
jgi:glycine/D-amino acid oxidase-like deaminating enzyme